MLSWVVHFGVLDKVCLVDIQGYVYGYGYVLWFYYIVNYGVLFLTRQALDNVHLSLIADT